MGRSRGGGGAARSSGARSGDGRSSGGFHGSVSRSSGRSFSGAHPSAPGGSPHRFVFWGSRPPRMGSSFFPFLLGMGIGRSATRTHTQASDAYPSTAASFSLYTSTPPTYPRNSRDALLKGCGCAVLVLITILFLSMAASGTLWWGVQSGVHEREELSASETVETAYYSDQDGGWISSSLTLESGLKDFYHETGVQPYVLILPNGETTSITELQSVAEEQYEALFEDEGHFLLVFCDDGEGAYNWAYCAGSAATSVMDDEAVQVLSDELDRAYADMSLSEEEIFSQAFARTASTIMDKSASTVASVLRVVLIVLVCLAVLIGCIYFFRQHRARKQAEEAREKQEFEAKLKEPLETLSDQHIEDLAKKYTDT